MPLVVNESAHQKDVALQLQSICKFNAFEYIDGVIKINESCRMCMQCVKEGPSGAITFVEIEKERVAHNKDMYKGVCVVAEIRNKVVANVTYELLGKARELAECIKHPVQVVVMGLNVKDVVNELCYYADEVYVYDNSSLEDFLPDPYTAAMDDFITKYRPSCILVAATNNGRSLAPKVAARFRTGLTADCTKLLMKDDTDLVQIRPAFGGNIMAEILTSNTRPQICTVRAGIFPIVKPTEKKGRIIYSEMDRKLLITKCKILKVEKKPDFIDIADATIIVAAGRGIRNAAGLALIDELALILKAQTACTRPLVENGWFNPRRQIGLSGRTVRPKLIIACGISGSVQFAAGMSGADRIIAINSDPNAKIFDLAHYSVIGDVYEVLPKLITMLKGAI